MLLEQSFGPRNSVKADVGESIQIIGSNSFTSTISDACKGKEKEFTFGASLDLNSLEESKIVSSFQSKSHIPRFLLLIGESFLPKSKNTDELRFDFVDVRQDKK